MMRTRCLTALLWGALAGCGGKAPGVSTYQVTVHCQTKDGRPVPLVSLSSERAAVGAVTNAQGLATLVLDGREGEEVPLHIDKLPPEHVELRPGDAHLVVLKNLGKVGPQGITVGHDIVLRRTKESYSVLVAAEQLPDAEVAANGVKLARLNSRGAAAFRVEGRPGEELKVAILTANNPRVSAQDPTKVFMLPENGGVLSFRSSVTLAAIAAAEQAAAPVAKRKHRSKPKLGEEPKQIPFGQTLSAGSKKK